jgi:hypothetical protein
MCRRFAGLLAAGALAAATLTCREPTATVPTIPLGLVSAFVGSADGQYVVRPEGTFVLATEGPTADSRSTLDTCLLGPYDPAFQPPEQVEAGDSIIFTAGATTAILRPELGVVTRYVANPAAFPLVPGTAVTFTIPGVVAGFPASAISALTPPAVTTLTPFPNVPSATDPLTLQWEPVGDDSSRFEVLLLYATAGSLNFNEQVVCDWRDDGSGTIRPELLSSWRESEFKRAEVTRYRTQREMIDDAVLFLLTTFDTLLPIIQ